MDQKVNDKSEFRCNSCNKNYASKSSLCNHNKKFHNSDGLLKTENSTITFDKRLKLTDINLNQSIAVKIYK
jgi:hypothetical protein